MASMEKHIPGAVLAKIVSYVGEDGVDALRNWILAGREGRDAVYSEECLSQVRLDKSEYYLWWGMRKCIYFKFFRKCLKARNPYALYAESNKSAAYPQLIGQCYGKYSWLATHRNLKYYVFEEDDAEELRGRVARNLQ